MRDLKYILVDKKPVAVEDLSTWGDWFETHTRRVAFEELKHPFDKEKNCNISTVFLGSYHNFGDTGEPILFETMIFGGEHDQYQERYCTWEEAEIGHKQAVQMVINGYELDKQPDHLC